MEADSRSYTCPRCGRASYNPHDVVQKYCGSCHDWTGPVLAEDLDALVEEAERGYDITIGPSQARMIISALERRESFWRNQLGDDDYERALAHWRTQCQSPAPCSCGCGCEPDGEWHFTESRCACLGLGCPCVTDVPSESATQPNRPL